MCMFAQFSFSQSLSDRFDCSQISDPDDWSAGHHPISSTKFYTCYKSLFDLRRQQLEAACLAAEGSVRKSLFFIRDYRCQRRPWLAASQRQADIIRPRIG